MMTQATSLNVDLASETHQSCISGDHSPQSVHGGGDEEHGAHDSSYACLLEAQSSQYSADPDKYQFKLMCVRICMMLS